VFWWIVFSMLETEMDTILKLFLALGSNHVTGFAYALRGICGVLQTRNCNSIYEVVEGPLQ
jgi:hypothetical protein